MAVHEAYLGVTVDHLYTNCPALVKADRRGGALWQPGTKAKGTVDPLGSDVCGWCRSVYIARKMQ